MELWYWIGGAVASGLLVYLVIALLKPLGLLGEPWVSVLALNLALEARRRPVAFA